MDSPLCSLYVLAMPGHFSSPDDAPMPVFEERAHTLALELSNAQYCDLLTALVWVTCRDIRQVASVRLAALEGELADEWVKHPAAMADFHANPDHVFNIDIRDQSPSHTLLGSLERGDVRSLGLFPGEIEPRAIAASVWAAGGICGGEVGRRVIGGCDCAGQKVLGVMIDWSDLRAVHPAAFTLHQPAPCEAEVDEAIKQLAAQNGTLSQNRTEDLLGSRWPGQRDLIRMRYKTLFPDTRPGRPRKHAFAGPD